MTIWQIIEDLKWQLKGLYSYRKSRLSQFWGMPPGQDFMIKPILFHNSERPLYIVGAVNVFRVYIPCLSRIFLITRFYFKLVQLIKQKAALKMEYAAFFE
jgi:hypothetical protein